MSDRPGRFGSEPDASPDDGTGTIRWYELVDETIARLETASDPETAKREASWIVDEFAGVDERGSSGRRELVTTGAMAAFDSAVARRVAGEPLQYVLGHWPFRRLDLMVDARVLIPRPETEWMVDIAVAEVQRCVSSLPEDPPPVVVDLGTGSGAIGLSLAVETPAEVWLTDRSPDALAVARANLAGIGPAAIRVRVAHGSWFEALADDLRGRVDVIVTNPPYVATGDVVDPVVARWEPPDALFSGDDGLDDLRVLIAAAPLWLSPAGVMVSEIGAGQAAAVLALAEGAGLDARVVDDLSGRPRALVARRSSSG